MLHRAGLVEVLEHGYRCLRCSKETKVICKMVAHWHTHPLLPEDASRLAFYEQQMTRLCVLSKSMRCHMCSKTFLRAKDAIEHVWRWHLGHTRQFVKMIQLEAAFIYTDTGWVKCRRCQVVHSNILHFLSHQCSKKPAESSAPLRSKKDEDGVFARYIKEEGGFYACLQCEKSFPFLSHAHRHALQHAKHVCPQCGKQEKSLTALHAHLHLTHGVHVACPDCDRTFTTLGGMHKHQTESHGKGEQSS